MLNYTHIRPRRMAYAGATAGPTAAQNSTIQIFNNSQYAEYLMIRNFSLEASANVVTIAGVTQTNLALSAVTATPMLAGEALPPGLVTAGTTATALTVGYRWVTINTTSSPWGYDYPIAILPPNWSFFIQDSGTNHTCVFSLMWEAIKPEDLEPEMWELANLTALAAQGG